MEETLRRLAAAMNKKEVDFMGMEYAPSLWDAIIGVKHGATLVYARCPRAWVYQKVTAADLDNADPVGMLIAAHRLGNIEELEWEDISEIRWAYTFYFGVGFLVWDMDESRIRKFTLCNSCRSLLEFTGDNSPFEYQGSYYCEECKEDNFFRCDHCGKYIHDDDSVYIEDSYDRVCEECAETHYYRCEECGDYISENHGDDNIELCNRCRERYYVCCDKCGEIVHEDNAYYSERRGAYLCESCHGNEKDFIHYYSYKPDFTFYHTPDEQGKLPYLGFELESGGLKYCSDADEIAAEIQDEDYYVLKSDNSIPEYGFELVSQPMTLEYHRQFRWRNILKKMSVAGLRSHDLGSEACGLHVHVSKNFMRPHHWVIVDWFVSRCQKQWEIVARRPECHWSEFKKLGKGEKVTDKFGKSGGSRYQAVNFDNFSTVEFRLFRGTLKYETLMATLEIVDCLVRWAKQARVWELLRCNGKIWDVFIKYLQDNAEKYPYAVEYLTAKELM